MVLRKMLKLPDVCAATAERTTKVYDNIAKGLFSPGVKTAARSVAWPEDEVAAINDARIAGKSDDEMRHLVKQLIAARSTGRMPTIEAMPKTHAAPAGAEPVKRPRGRPRKTPVEAQTATQPAKRGRGRPRGSVGAAKRAALSR